jgi:hypothetical protein
VNAACSQPAPQPWIASGLVVSLVPRDFTHSHAWCRLWGCRCSRPGRAGGHPQCGRLHGNCHGGQRGPGGAVKGGCWAVAHVHVLMRRCAATAPGGSSAGPVPCSSRGWGGSTTGGNGAGSRLGLAWSSASPGCSAAKAAPEGGGRCFKRRKAIAVQRAVMLSAALSLLHSVGQYFECGDHTVSRQLQHDCTARQQGTHME